MKEINLNKIADFKEWHESARECILSGIPPNQIVWQTDTNKQTNLFIDTPVHIAKNKIEKISVPASFLDMAQSAICHSSPQRYDLLYRILYRLQYKNKNLLNLKTDSDVMHLQKLVKAVRRDAYKIKAFLRFRVLEIEEREIYIAWHEPEHYTLEMVTDFFKTRFRNMQWSILTPYRAAHWNGVALAYEDNPDPALFPTEDDFERHWLTYYKNIFNPARLKTSAMLNQMPKKYWKTMPETVLIKDMIDTAEQKTREMIQKSNGA